MMGRLLGAGASYLPLTYLGRVEEALASTSELIEHQESGARALCLARLGRLTEAQEILRKFLYEIETDEDKSQLVFPMLVLAVELADPEAATALAPKLSGQNKYANLVGSSGGRILGGASALLGDHKGARAHYQAALEILAKVRHRPELALTRLELAVLLLDHYPEERAEALEHLDFAITELRDMKMQPALERALSRREILGA